MLIQRLRRRVRGVGAYIIVLLLALPLALVGFNWFGRSGGNVVIATINGEELHLAELDRYTYQERRRILENQGDAVDPAAIDVAALRQSTLGMLLSRKALVQRARSLDLTLSKARVDNYLRAQSQFQEAGRFSPQRYEWQLQQGGYTPAWYREIQHDSLLISQLSAVTQLSEFTTETELQDLLGVASERRAIRYMLLSPQAAQEHIKLDEQALQEAFETKREEYRQPEMISIEALALRRSAFYQNIDEKQVRSYYDQELTMLSARIEAAHILIADDGSDEDIAAGERVAQLRKRLTAGEDFAELSAEYSDDLLNAEEGGVLGTVTSGDLPAALYNALVALSPGEITLAPVRSEAGLHFLHRLETVVPDYAKRGAEIRQRLQQIYSEATYRQAQERLAELSFNASDLDSVAEAMAIELSRSSPFSKNDLTAEGLAAYPKLRAAAFSEAVLEQGENSQPIELGVDEDDERTVVLRLAERTPSRLLSFAEAEPALREDLSSELSAQWLREEAQHLERQLNHDAQTTVDELAHNGGYEWYARPNLLRYGSEGTPNEVVRAAFRLPAPSTGTKSVTTVQLPDGSQAVLALLSLQQLDQQLLSPQQRRDWQQNMRRQFGDSEDRSYRRYILLSASVQ